MGEKHFDKAKALALMSGGLDSTLAIHLVKRQSIDVVALHFTSFFCGVDPVREDSSVLVVSRQLGVPVIFKPKGMDFLDIVRNPRFGHGKNINPCIDCRIHSFKKARQVMDETGASFIITGEVVGQRPMSQRRDTIRLIDKESGCDGIVLRPLSAMRLPETIPEQTGLVDRDQLLGIAGRGRKVQLKMARELGLTGYQSPAGGCLLTDKNFSDRVRDLLQDRDIIAPEELELLSIGRHVRIRPGLKIVVGRREAENKRLEEFKSSGSLYYPIGFPGPTVLAQGRPEPMEERLIGGIIRRYSKLSTRGERIGVRDPSSPERMVTVGDVADEEWVLEHLI